uniref:Uncharacterized protein n=1 Tax=viral metagenome TaxID=1070528 RepID=A0A6C0IY18_9ZZZZ
MYKSKFRERRERRYRKKTTTKKDAETHLPYLKKKVAELDAKLKDKDLTKERDLDGIVEGIIDGLHEIDDYLPTGLDDTLNAVEEHGLDPKNILNLLLPLVNVFNYWKYLTNKHHRKQTKILDDHLRSDKSGTTTEKATAHDTVVDKLNSLDEPKYKDLIPLAVISIAAAYAKPPYGSLAGAILSQFTILK